VEKYGRARQATDDNIIRRMRIACRIPETTNTQTQYVINITVPLQQWLYERASILHYTYIVCLFQYTSSYSPYLNAVCSIFDLRKCSPWRQRKFL